MVDRSHQRPGQAGPMDRFDWRVTECAPRGYPVRVIQGDLVFDDGGSLYVPSRRVVNNGWGADGSIHLAGDDLKPVPVRLILTWLSYTEDRFYHGSFDLPADRMLTLFRNGLPSPRNGRHITYARMIVGMAPGGHVSVWMGAERVVTEVAAFRGSQADVPWAGVLGDPDVTREAHVAATLEETRTIRSKELLAERPDLAGRWASYSSCRFIWSPRTEPGSPVRAVWIHGFNGEAEYVDLAPRVGAGSAAAVARAVPRKLISRWTHPAGMEMTTEAQLDEIETFAAFQEQSEGGPTRPLVLLIGAHGVMLAVDTGPAQPDHLHRMTRVRVDVYGGV